MWSTRPAAGRKQDRHVLAHAGIGDEGHVGDRHLQTGDELQGQQLDGLVELLLGHRKWERVASGGVEPACVVGERGVALGADPLDDLAHVLLDRGATRHEGAQVLSGAGRTAQRLRERGVEPTVFPSPEEWRKWSGKNG